MNELFNIIKIICILQFGLITLLTISIFFYKSYLSFSIKHAKKIALKIENLLNQYINELIEIKPSDYKLFKRHLYDILTVIIRLDLINQGNNHWKNIKEVLFRELLLPKARKDAVKSKWYKRYFATQVFQQAFHKQDIKLIKGLIADLVPLVALNAARIAISTDSETLIKQLIKSFAENRVLQNGIFIQAIEPKISALELICNYLNHEKDIYERVFCYQMLSNVPNLYPKKIIFKDMDSKNIDLQIAALTCYILSRPKNVHSLFAKKIQDEHWEIRAKIAKLIGKVGNSEMCPLLEKALKDKNWWVRINAAESLYQLGPEGIQILKNQKAEEDRFAYDAATRSLALAEMVTKQ